MVYSSVQKERNTDMEDDWNDAEEYELDQLAQDREDDEPDDGEGEEEDGPEFEPREDFGHFGEAGLWD
jgi:hypothetical protein